MVMYFIQKAQIDISLEYNAILVPPKDYGIFEEVNISLLIKFLIYMYFYQYCGQLISWNDMHTVLFINYILFFYNF